MTKEPLTTAGSLPRLNFKILPEFVLFLKNVVKIYTFSGDSHVFLVCSLNVEPQSADKKGSLQNKTLQESVYLIPCGVFDFGSPVYYFFKLVIGLCLGGDTRNPHILS